MDLKSGHNLLVVCAICCLLVACAPLAEGTTATAERATSIPTVPVPTTEPALTAVPVPAPGFTLSTLDGGEVSLSDYEGEWVILNFWATWCPPCVSEMPYLQNLADRGLNVLGVNMTETPEEVQQFTAKHGIDFPILMEPDVNTILDYQARQLPRTVIIAPDGTISLRIAGPIDGQQLDPWLDEHGVR